MSNCGNYLIMVISRSCEPTNQLWYCDLKKLNHEIRENLPFVKLVDNFDAKYEVILKLKRKIILLVFPNSKIENSVCDQ